MRSGSSPVAPSSGRCGRRPSERVLLDPVARPALSSSAFCSASAAPASGSPAPRHHDRGVERGTSASPGDPRAEMCNPAGTVHGGIAATLLDSAMSCAVHSTLLQASATRPSTCSALHPSRSAPITGTSSRPASGPSRPSRRDRGRPPPRLRGKGLGARHDHLPRDARRLLGCAPCLASVHPSRGAPKGTSSGGPKLVRRGREGRPHPRKRPRPVGPGPGSRRQRSTRRTRPAERASGESPARARARSCRRERATHRRGTPRQKWTADDWTDEGDVRDQARGTVAPRQHQDGNRGPSTAMSTAAGAGREPAARRRQRLRGCRRRKGWAEAPAALRERTARVRARPLRGGPTAARVVGAATRRRHPVCESSTA